MADPATGCGPRAVPAVPSPPPPGAPAPGTAGAARASEPPATAPGVTVRPFEPGDRDGVRAMRLSRRSLYHRFFVGSPHIPVAYIDALARVDHWHREALVALAGTEIVGVAEYVRDGARPRTADLAVMVSDGWQRRGVARRLLTALTALARERGVDELRADVLAGNGAATAALRRGWPDASATRAEGGSVGYLLPLPPRGRPRAR